MQEGDSPFWIMVSRPMLKACNASNEDVVASIDPGFAVAYAALGNPYSNLGETGLAEANNRKAYELREHVSEHERLYIESHYHQFVTGTWSRRARLMRSGPRPIPMTMLRAPISRSSTATWASLIEAWSLPRKPCALPRTTAKATRTLSSLLRKKS